MTTPTEELIQVNEELDGQGSSLDTINTSTESTANVLENAVDGVTNALETVDYSHHEIHNGSHYFYTDSVTLGSGANQTYLITTPDTTKWVHLIFSFDGTAVTSFTIDEAGDRVGTNLQTVFNNNRNSANTAGITIHKGISGGSTDGTEIYTYASGTAQGNSRSPSLGRSDQEIVLKQNTKYLITVLSGTAGNLTNVMFEWYEHTNVS